MERFPLAQAHVSNERSNAHVRHRTCWNSHGPSTTNHGVTKGEKEKKGEGTLTSAGGLTDLSHLTRIPSRTPDSEHGRFGPQ